MKNIKKLVATSVAVLSVMSPLKASADELVQASSKNSSIHGEKTSKDTSSSNDQDTSDTTVMLILMP